MSELFEVFAGHLNKLGRGDVLVRDVHKDGESVLVFLTKGGATVSTVVTTQSLGDPRTVKATISKALVALNRQVAVGGKTAAAGVH